MILDLFKGVTAGLESPAETLEEISPNDASDLAHVTRALYIGTGGNLRVTAKGGATVTIPNLPSGSVLPIRVSRVHETATTASGLIGLS
ncbi:MAG: hypothetical protein AAGJ52_13280 [Pseudomonadota bacterium]